MTTTLQELQFDRTGAATSPVSVDALYLHVPFCSHKCHYCDFYSIVDRADRQEEFVDAIARELTRWTTDTPGDKTETLRPKTIFVGGGTPSLLRPTLWQKLLDVMRSRGVLDLVDEFTVEANPDTVTDELIGILTGAGVNRISLGVQSFHRPLLAMLQRDHEPTHVCRAVERVRRAGIENVNVDLIFAVPGQTCAMIDTDLDAALALNPSHISYYNLTYEPGTPMTSRMQSGSLTPAPESLERAMYVRVIERMNIAGFEHYEISSWAKQRTQKNREAEKQGIEKTGKNQTAPTALSCSLCRHNLIYWNNGNWLGIGPSAASHIDGRRWKNEKHLGRYIADSPWPTVVDPECLDVDRRVGEELMLGLRLLNGVDCDQLQDRMRADDPRWDTIDALVDMGMLQRSASRLHLTKKGLFVADAVVGKLL